MEMSQRSQGGGYEQRERTTANLKAREADVDNEESTVLSTIENASAPRTAINRDFHSGPEQAA